ncbi:hypothetical protein [Paenibacillus luteus]|uniref:hypothetical protein n=1 Tax=Paenibacillus luteus TaxID=2545753 RepID=UPI001141794F|nr:hypothetical protein [Paenibacillus luteus]
MKWIWKNRAGSGFPLTVAIVLVILLLSCAIYEYLRLSIIASGVRDAVQSSIIAVSTENYAHVYNGLREGYSGGYLLNASNGWREHVTTGDVLERLDQTLGLTAKGSDHIKFAGLNKEFTISELQVLIHNAPFAPSSSAEAPRFEATVTLTLEVPLSFGWTNLPPMKSTLTVKAGYTPKF